MRGRPEARPGPRGPRTNVPPLYTPAFWTACAVHFTGAMSLAMFVLVPLLIRELGGSDLTIGLVLGVATAASVVTRPFVGMFLDSLGRRPVLLAAGVANALSWLPFLWLRSAGPWLYVLVTLHAVVWGALFASYFTYAADLTPPERRAEGIAVFGVFGLTPNGIAPMLGEAIIARSGFPAFLLTASGFALLSVALTTLVPPRRPVLRAADAVPHAGLRALRQAATHPGLPLVLGVTVVLGVAINAAFFFVAPFTRDVGLTRSGPFFAAYAAMSVTIRLFGRRALDVLGAHLVSYPAFAFFGLGLAGLALLPAPGVLILSGLACGAGHGTLFPVLNALAITRAPARLQGTVVSLHTAALDLGAVVGTPLCGLLAEWVGFRAMFQVMGAACLAGLVLMAADPARTRRLGA
jgi:MFS family permease